MIYVGYFFSFIGWGSLIWEALVRYCPVGFKWIYLGTTTAQPIVKIGISKGYKFRERMIDESIEGSKERIVFVARTFFAYELEQSLHRVYRKRRKPFKGSGRTEWFRLGFFQKIGAVGIMILASLLSHLTILIILIFILKLWKEIISSLFLTG